MNGSALSASDLISLTRSSINSSSRPNNRQIVVRVQSHAIAHLPSTRPVHSLCFVRAKNASVKPSRGLPPALFLVFADKRKAPRIALGGKGRWCSTARGVPWLFLERDFYEK